MHFASAAQPFLVPSDLAWHGVYRACIYINQPTPNWCRWTQEGLAVCVCVWVCHPPAQLARYYAAAALHERVGSSFNVMHTRKKFRSRLSCECDSAGLYCTAQWSTVGELVGCISVAVWGPTSAWWRVARAFFFFCFLGIAQRTAGCVRKQWTISDSTALAISRVRVYTVDGICCRIAHDAVLHVTGSSTVQWCTFYAEFTLVYCTVTLEPTAFSYVAVRYMWRVRKNVVEAKLRIGTPLVITLTSCDYGWWSALHWLVTIADIVASSNRVNWSQMYRVGTNSGANVATKTRHQQSSRRPDCGPHSWWSYRARKSPRRH